jgi:hypothetical protein
MAGCAVAEDLKDAFGFWLKMWRFREDRRQSRFARSARRRIAIQQPRECDAASAAGHVAEKSAAA